MGNEIDDPGDGLLKNIVGLEGFRGYQDGRLLIADQDHRDHMGVLRVDVGDRDLQTDDDEIEDEESDVSQKLTHGDLLEVGESLLKGCVSRWDSMFSAFLKKS